MSGVLGPKVEIDGRRATVEDVWLLDASVRGHFTAMQVRGRATLGVDLHLARLDAATQELFGVGLDGDLVRGYVLHALSDDTTDASVRVNVFRPSIDEDVSVVVSVRPPAAEPPASQSLQTVEYRRPLAHIKQASGWGQSYYGGLARGNGFDEALFVGPDDLICEGSMTNIGFIDGDAIVWPDAPSLRGIMMQVLQRELERARVSWRYAPVHVGELGSFAGAFLTNSHGMATVARIDDLRLSTDAELVRTAAGLLAVAPLDPI